MSIRGPGWRADCPKCGGVGQFEVLQPTVGASRIEVCDQCVGRSPAPVVDGKPCTVCKGSDPDCRWGGVPANCSMWGKDFPEATRPQPAQDEEREAFIRLLDAADRYNGVRSGGGPLQGQLILAVRHAYRVLGIGRTEKQPPFSEDAITALRQHGGESGLREAGFAAGIAAAYDAARGTNADMCKSPVTAYQTMLAAILRVNDPLRAAAAYPRAALGGGGPNA